MKKYSTLLWTSITREGVSSPILAIIPSPFWFRQNQLGSQKPCKNPSLGSDIIKMSVFPLSLFLKEFIFKGGLSGWMIRQFLNALKSLSL